MDNKVLTIETAQALYNDLRSRLDETKEDIDLVLSSKLDDATVEEGYLYLTSTEGAVIGPLGPFSGTGGGGGGGSSNNAVLTLTNNNKDKWLINTIPEGAACVIKIKWSSLEDEVPNGPGTATIRVNNEIKKSADIPQGEYELDVSSYLNLGVNNIKFTITDVESNSKSINFRVTLVTLGLKTVFEDQIPLSDSINYSYIATGNVDKYMHFILDGEELTEEPVLVTSSGRQINQLIPKQPHGSHTLEVYFEAVINGESTFSNHLYHDLICYDKGNTTPIIASTFRTEKVSQYSVVNIPYRVFRYNYNDNPVQLFVGIYEGDSTEPTWHQEGADLTVNNNELQNWPYRANTSGHITLMIKSGPTEKYFDFNVEKVVDILPAEATPSLYLTSQGRKNSEPEEFRSRWDYEDIHCDLRNFNWSSNGWISNKVEPRKPTEEDSSTTYTSTVLRVNGGATVTIPYQPFASTVADKDIKVTGKTLEFEFATSTVDNYETPIISCMNDGIGFEITAQSATYYSSHSSVTSQYKEDEHVRISFVIGKRSADDSYESNGSRIMYIYVNGIISGAIQYAEQDEDFSQPVPQYITIGSSAATVDIYNIRIYDQDLSRRQVVQNWIADMQDTSTMLFQHRHNDIYGTDGVSIDYRNLPSDLPYMILKINNDDERYARVGDLLPQDKKDKTIMSGRFVDPRDSEREKVNWRSFTFKNCEVVTQGTSSQQYPIKNYKLKFNGGFLMANQNPEDKPLKKYAMNENAVPTKTFVFKADYASSEGANNVELVRFYNDNNPSPTPPQKKNPKIRLGIDGFPIVLFQELPGGTIKFIGKYNFNNHKGTEEVYGLDQHGAEYELDKNTKVATVVSEGIPDESWEMCDNDSEMGRWKRPAQGNTPAEIIEDLIGPWGVSEADAPHDFEARFPSDWYDAHTDGYLPEIIKYQRFVDLQAWVASTDTGNITELVVDEDGNKHVVDTGIPVWADLERTAEIDEHDPETGELIYHGRELSPAVIFPDGEYDEDNIPYRLAKFRNEFAKYFDKKASLYYYLFTEMFLMVDSRVKNSFPTYFAVTDKFPDIDPETGEPIYDKVYKFDPETGDPIIDEETGEQAYDLVLREHIEEVTDDNGWPVGRWTWLPYDMDTANGINNEGKLVFNYDLEDTDIIAGGTVFNGQDSVLWNNIRMCFSTDLSSAYAELRKEKNFSYEDIEKRFEDHQSAWPVMVFNDDAYYKYILPLLQGGKNRLAMCLGSKEQQRKWWLYNRFRYLDSKYDTGYAEQSLMFRAYNAGTLKITPYADVYVRVKMGTAFNYKVRAKRGDEVTLEVNWSPNDKECWIYSIDQIKYIDGFGSFNPDTLDISDGIRLQRLDLAASSTKPNERLEEFTANNNTQLNSLNLKYCVALHNSVGLSSCKNLEYAYFENTSVPGVTFSDGGILKVVHLPKTIKTLAFIRQPYIRDLLIQGFDDEDFYLTRLVLIDMNEYMQGRFLSLLSKVRPGSGVNLQGFNLTFNTRAEVDIFIRTLNTMKGVSGDLIDGHALVKGTLKINEPVNYDYIKMVHEGGTDPDDGETYPGYPQLTFDCQISKNIEFWPEDGSGDEPLYKIEDTLATEVTYEGDALVKEDAQIGDRWYSYRFVGWSEEPFGEADPYILSNIDRSLKLYAAFEAIPYMKVTFYSWDGTTILSEDDRVPRGSDASSFAPTVTLPAGTTELLGWSSIDNKHEEDNVITNIQEDTDLYAVPNWTVNSISITQDPDKVDYYVDDVFDPTGMIVTANKAYLGDVEVKKYIYSTDPLTSEDEEIEISLEGQTAAVAIGIAESIGIDTIPTRLVYTVSDSTIPIDMRDKFDPAGMKIVTYFSNGNVSAPISYSTDSGIDWDNKEPFTEVKTYPITITYKELSCLLNIVATPTISTILDENKWEVISAVSSQGNARAYWSIGDEKIVDISKSSNQVDVHITKGLWRTSTWSFRIVAFDHNMSVESPDVHTITFGAAKRITLGADPIEICGSMFYPHNKDNMWAESWNVGCQGDYILSRFEMALPEDLTSCIKTVHKGQSTYDITEPFTPEGSIMIQGKIAQQDNRLYLPSVIELFGSSHNYSFVLDESSVGSQFEYYIGKSSIRDYMIKYSDEASPGASRWWTRSFSRLYFATADTLAQFRYAVVENTGISGRDIDAAMQPCGFAVFFTV